MDKLKQWVVLTLVTCLAIAAAGWVLVVSPKRAEADSLHQQAADQVAKNAQLATQLQVLKAKAKDLPKEQAKVAAVAEKVPGNPALPGLVRALLDAAKNSGVELVSITPGQPTAATASSAAGKPVAPTAAGAPAAGAAGGAAAGQLMRIPLTLNVVGGYFETQQFLASVEDMPRALRVQNLSMAPGASPTDKAAGAPAPTANDGRTLASVITGEVFMASTSPAASAGTAASGAAAAPNIAAAAPSTATPAN